MRRLRRLTAATLQFPPPEQMEELDAGTDPNDFDDLERYDLRVAGLGD